MRARGGRLRTNRTAAITSFRAVRRGREPGLKVIHPQARGMNHCAAFDTRRMGVAKKQLQILNRSNSSLADEDTARKPCQPVARSRIDAANQHFSQDVLPRLP